MNRSFLAAIACAMMLVAPGPSFAQHSPPSAPGYHAAPAPAYHPAPAPVYHPAPPPPSHPTNGGFSFPHETNARPPAVYPSRVAPRPGYHVAPQQSYVRNYPPHVPYRSGPYRYWRGPVLSNRHRWGWWGWNHGVVWYPVPYYWGGGFWGPWVIGVTGVVLFGSIIDYDNYTIYPSYEIEPTSPGAQLLNDYGLTQTQCGPPNLVAIWGTDNSVICAYPNNLVAPGNYELDPATLTLQSLGTSPNP